MTAPSAENGSYRAQVPLSQIDVAPENLRFDQPADEGIAQLADTLAVDQIIDIICRPGKKGEAKFMALDGRRRLFAWQLLISDGRISADHPVWVTVETEDDRIARAALLSGTERRDTHMADVIETIGRLKSKKMPVAKIAAAVGYAPLLVERWAALSKLPAPAFRAMRENRLTLKQAQLLTRVKDQSLRDQLISDALAGPMSDATLEHLVNKDAITVHDRHFRLATKAAYLAAGGRIEADLFGDTPDIVHDKEVLLKVWSERAKPAALALRAEGVEPFAVPEPRRTSPSPNYDVLPMDSRQSHTPEQAEAFAAAEKAVFELRQSFHALEELSDEHLPKVTELVLAQLEAARTLHTRSKIQGAALYPDQDFGVGVVFFGTTATASIDPQPASSDEPATTGDGPTYTPAATAQVIPITPISTGARTNTLHERYTDVATRGLIRAVAEDPRAALNLTVARLWVSVGLNAAGDPAQSVSTLQAARYVRNGVNPINNLDGEVYETLEGWREAYTASGLRPIAWVDTLANGDKLTLLAQLTALTLNAREFSLSVPRHAARAEAVELAEMTDYDISTYWTPDVEFCTAHRKADLLELLKTMGADAEEADRMKQDELAVFVAEKAAELGWAPPSLSFKLSDVCDNEEPSDTEDDPHSDATDESEQDAEAA